MNPFTNSLSPFQIPYIKNVKLVKFELRPFLQNIIYLILNHSHLKMNLLQLKQFLLLENTWIHTFSILDIELQILPQNTQPFKCLFLYKVPLHIKYIEEQ